MGQLIVNGVRHSVDADPEMPLVLVLRERLGLTGTKVGCAHGACGACTVLVAGEARHACMLTLADLGELEVTTIEGLGTAQHPHPLQQAFIEEQATQCGYCAGGLVLAAKALLDVNPHPSAAEIRTALEHNLCRCGSHVRVVRAVQRTAQRGA